MDRAAKLAAVASIEVSLMEAARRSQMESIREMLAGYAEKLGFAPNEISAAIDQALKDAGTTP